MKIRNEWLTDNPGEVKAVRLSKKPGLEGMVQTIHAMERIVDRGAWNPLIRKHAIKAVKSSRPLAQLKELYNYLLRRIRYVHDVRGMETLQTPVYTLKAGGGDCDDLTILFNSAARSIGFRTGYIIAGKNGHFSHVLSAVDVKGVTVPVDLAQRRFGKVNRNRYDTFKTVFLAS